jgi:Secretion system C-terminal sorting domain
MKKWLIVVVLLTHFTTQAQYIGTPPTRNGNIGSGEYGNHTNGFNSWTDGTRTFYMAWDNTNLYLAVNDNGSSSNDEFVIYIDTDPSTPVNGGTGNIDGIGGFDGVNYGRLPFSANFCAFVRNDYHQHRTSSGTWSGANNNDANIQKTTSGNTQEMQIAWSLMGGRPAAFNFFIYLNGFEPYSGNSFYTTNGDNDQSNNKLNLTGRKYFSVAATTNGSSTPPFSRLCYTNPRPGHNTVTTYGTSFYNVTVNTNTATTISSLGAALAVDGNLYIGGNDDLSMNTNAITLKGNISRYQPTGAISNMGLIAFSGTTDQTQTGNITYTAGVTINKASGKLILASNGSNIGMAMDNSSTLTLTSGTIDSRTHATKVEIKTGANISAGNSSSYIDGFLQINNLTTTKTFPVGKSSFNPATIVNTGAADNFTVIVNDYLTSDGTSLGVQGPNQVVNRTWDVTEATPGGSVVNLSLEWNAAEELLAFNRTLCYVGHYTSGAWQADYSGAAAGAGPYTRTKTNITNFSAFGIASTGALALPTLNFKVSKQNKENLLIWQTTEEHANTIYNVQSSIDGIHFTSFHQTKAIGVKADNFYKYAAVDKRTHFSKIYYRLAVQKDNTVQYSSIISIDANADKVLWTIYPAQQKNNFVVSTNMEQKTILWITNAMGQVIETKAIATGKQQCMIDLNSYKSGIYWLSILDNKQNITSKQIIVN